MTANNHIIIIGHTWPEPNTTAAGHRMVQLLEAFAENGFQIFFGSTAAKTEFSAELSTLNIQEVDIKLNDSSFDEWVKKVAPDVVVFDRYMVEEQFGWRVVESAPNALRILNTEDLHSLRDYREVALKKRTDFNNQDWLATDKAKREMASIFRSDLTLVVSDFEEKLLIDRVGVPKSHVLHLPFMLPELTDTAIQAWPTFEERKDMVCFGNGKHAPNVDSIKHLKTVLWPQIRERLPDVRLHIFGAYLPESIRQMHNEKEGFLVNGWIENLDAELQKVRLNLAPLRFGAGIKGKLVDAMQSGLPSITTPIGAEGMHGQLPWLSNITEKDDDFIVATIKYYQNPDLWRDAKQKGIAIINSCYDANKLKQRFFKRIDDLEENIEKHRAQNFIGLMLQHQTMSATKFMGKWIEEKNRKKEESRA